MRKWIIVLFTLTFLVMLGVSLKNQLPKEVQEFADASCKLSKSVLTGSEVLRAEKLDNGDVKKYYVLSYEKFLEDGKVTGKDGITITWQGGQSIHFQEKVILTFDKNGDVVQRTCWDSSNKMLSQTVFKK